MKCRRADDYKTNKAIMKDIWNAICQSQVIIADMTGLNPNVMYELGISHTVGKETIMIIQQNLSENQKFPFDISHIRRIQYRNEIEEYPRFKKELSKTLDFVLEEAKGSFTEKSEEKGEGAEQQEYTVLCRVNVGKRKEIKGLAFTVYSVDFRTDKTSFSEDRQ
jgi:hypothetical protein